MDQTNSITRREALAVSAAMAGGLALSPSAVPLAAAQEVTTQQAAGLVYDSSRDDRVGISGVMISNGTDVTTTDTAGRWSLPVADGQSLFVIKPRGWALPRDARTALPRYAYVHMPTGTPADLALRYEGVAPTGPLPASVDFGLMPAPEADAFTALLFTDPQPESAAEVGYIRDDVVALAQGTDAAFGVTTGDLMFDDLSFYGRYNDIIATIGLPWFNCPGNHDMNFDVPDDTHSRDTFIRTFGARDMAFQHGAATFFVLDNVEYLGADPARPNGIGRYRGRFRDHQLQFIRNVLSRVPTDTLVVFFFHIPLRTLAGSEPFNQTVNAEAFLNAISSHPHSYSFCGHTHTQEHWYLDAAHGFTGGVHHHQVLAAVSGSWWSGPLDERGIPIALQVDGAPNGYHVLSVDGTEVRTRFVAARDPNRGHLRLCLAPSYHGNAPEVLRAYRPGELLTGPISRAAVSSTAVIANFFVGGPRSRITLAVDGEAPVPMRKVEEVDPFVVEVYARNEATKKPWVQPARSSHLWRAALPSALSPGAHRLDVRAEDEFGGQHSAFMILEVQ